MFGRYNFNKTVTLTVKRDKKKIGSHKVIADFLASSVKVKKFEDNTLEIAGNDKDNKPFWYGGTGLDFEVK